MATPFDPTGLYPPFYDDAPDPSTLQWPWSQPPAPDPAAPGAAPPVPVAAPPVDPMLAMAPPEAPPAPLPQIEPPLAAPPLAAAPVPAPAAPLSPLPDLGPQPVPITELPSVGDRREQDALNQKALTDQAGFSEDVTRSNQDKATYIAQRRKEMADADVAAARQHVEDRKAADAITQVKMDAVIADATRIANTKIDPTGGLSGGRQIAGVLGAIIGGLVQGRTGSSRNAGMDALNDVINRGIDAQKADLANQREGVNLRQNVLAQEFAKHGDMYRAEEAVRLAALQHADDYLATEQQNYDPRGRTGLLIAGERAQVAAAKTQAGIAFADKTREQALKEREQGRKEAETLSTIAKNNAEAGKLRAEAGKVKASDQVFAPEVWAAMYPNNPPPPRAMNAKDYADHLGVVSKGQDIKNNALETTNIIPGVREPGAKTDFVAIGDKSDVGKLRAKVAANTTIVHLLDQALRLRTGYSNNNVADRDEWLQLKQTWGALKAKGKDALGLGVLSGDDYKLLEEYLGTDDPTSVRDPTAGIQAARRTALLDVNDALGAQGFRGTFDIPDTSKPPPSRRTPDDNALSAVLGRSEDIKRGPFTFSGDVRPVEPAPPAPTGLAQISSAAGGRIGAGGKNAATEAGRKVQHEQLDEWASQLSSPDAAVRDNAARLIGQVAGQPKEKSATDMSATDITVREYARQLLIDNIAGGLPVVQEQVR